MKKITVSILVSVLVVFFLSAAPASARANHFWPGLAVGLGSALVLGSIFLPQRSYSYSPPPSYYYGPPPAYYPPPPPSARGYWVQGHWEEGYGRYGDWERVWVPGYWERY
jgi:hypothetical protein